MSSPLWRPTCGKSRPLPWDRFGLPCPPPLFSSFFPSSRPSLCLVSPCLGAGIPRCRGRVIAADIEALGGCVRRRGGFSTWSRTWVGVVFARCRCEKRRGNSAAFFEKSWIPRAGALRKVASYSLRLSDYRGLVGLIRLLGSKHGGLVSLRRPGLSRLLCLSRQGGAKLDQGFAQNCLCNFSRRVQSESPLPGLRPDRGGVSRRRGLRTSVRTSCASFHLGELGGGPASRLPAACRFGRTARAGESRAFPAGRWRGFTWSLCLGSVGGAGLGVWLPAPLGCASRPGFSAPAAARRANLQRPDLAVYLNERLSLPCRGCGGFPRCRRGEAAAQGWPRSLLFGPRGHGRAPMPLVVDPFADRDRGAVKNRLRSH